MGDYTGTLNIVRQGAHIPLRLTLHITAAADGALSGTLDNVNEGITGIPASDFKLEGDKLSFSVVRVPGNWTGMITDGGTTLTGTWNEGTPLPLIFQRDTGAPAQQPSRRVAQIEDLSVFRSQFLNVDHAYSDSTRAQASVRLDALEDRAGTVSPEAFVIELCAITALADNAHSQCFPPRGDEAPIGFTALAGRFFITSATQEHAALLGADLLALDGHPVSAVRAQLRRLHGGLPARRDLFVAQVLNRPDLLHGAGLTASVRSAVYRVHTPEGRTIEDRVERASTPTARAVLPSPEKAPWSLQDPGHPFRWRDAPELDGVFIQLRQNIDSNDQKIVDFLVAAERWRVLLKRPNVILDMRQNQGGNFLLTRDLMMGWPKKVGPNGRIFVLMGPETFSAGIVSIAYLKQAGGGQVLLAGAPPGDRLTFFAEGTTHALPHSGLTVQPALERDDLAEGCRPYSDCIAVLAEPSSPTGSPPEEFDWLYGRKPVAVRSLEPDIAAPWTIGDYQSGRDPAIEALKRWLAASARPVE